MDGWIGRLDRSTINNAFSFSHYYTTHFAGHSTDVNPLFSLFALEVILSAAFAIKAFKKGVLYHGEDCNREPKNDPQILEPAFLLVNR